MSREDLQSRAEKNRILNRGLAQLKKEKLVSDYEKRTQEWKKDNMQTLFDRDQKITATRERRESNNNTYKEKTKIINQEASRAYNVTKNTMKNYLNSINNARIVRLRAKQGDQLNNKASIYSDEAFGHDTKKPRKPKEPPVELDEDGQPMKRPDDYKPPEPR